MVPSLLVAPSIEPYYSKRIQQKYSISKGCSSPLIQPERWANIDFLPNKREFLARRARRILAGGLETEVPDGWPSQFQGPIAWKPEDFRNEEPFIYYLSEEDKREIDEALLYFKSLELDGEEISKENFPLPVLGPRLCEIRDVIYDGIGVQVLRGLDVSLYSSADIVMIFLGVSSYIAGQRGLQDRDCNMIKHIIDTEREESKVELPLHTDVTCDIVATLTRKCSEKGGNGMIASSWTIYNELAATRPDLIHVLAKSDWPHDTYGRDPLYYHRALLYQAGGKAILNFSRRILTGHINEPRTLNIPNLSEAQAEALDAVHFIAIENHIKLSMEEGDMKFINNMGLLHGRDAFFENDPQAHSKRHLLRLWLHNPEKMWDLPEPLQLAWDRIFEDYERVGRWQMEPVIVSGIRMRGKSPCD